MRPQHEVKPSRVHHHQDSSTPNNEGILKCLLGGGETQATPKALGIRMAPESQQPHWGVGRGHYFPPAIFYLATLGKGRIKTF